MATRHLQVWLYSFLKALTVPEHLGTTSLSPQKDSHTLYLEQELESLKVVLDIKNKQLHQQEKKLMEIDKLVRPEADENDCWASRQAALLNHSTILLIYFFVFPEREKCEAG